MSITSKWVEWSANDPETVVHAEPDLVLPRYATIGVRDEMRFDVDVNVFYDPGSWRYAVDSLIVKKRRPWDSTIDTTTLRDLKIQEILRRGLANLAWIETPKGEAIPDRMPPEKAASIRALGPSSDEALRWVARIYTRAWAIHLPPTQDVQDQLGLTRPTASVWLRRARDRGLLTEPLDREYQDPNAETAAASAAAVLRMWDDD